MITVRPTALARRSFWRIARPAAVRELEQQIELHSPKGRKSWYYPLDFGYGVEVRPELWSDQWAGESNWRFIAEHLPPIAGSRILDIGCNAGLYALQMSAAGAEQVIGIERDTGQGEFVREWFGRRDGRDYSNIRYLAADAKQLDFEPLGRFDFVCLFCVLYHLREGADRVLDGIAKVSDTIVLQGNLPRLTSPKQDGIPFKELAGVEGMTDSLERHGFSEIQVIAPAGSPKPLVIGRKPAGERSPRTIG